MILTCQHLVREPLVMAIGAGSIVALKITSAALTGLGYQTAVDVAHGVAGVEGGRQET